MKFLDRLSSKPARGSGGTKQIDCHETPGIILLMGQSGTGKSSFVNLASGSQLQVGNGLESCTSDIQLSQPFDLDGRAITLVDTPGFDDTTKSDADILNVIAVYLTKGAQEVQGIVYLHRISDVKVGGAARRNFTMFQKICGVDALRNVIIATTRWDEVDRSEAMTREEGLRSVFKPALDGGALLLRHEGTPESAHAILRHLLGKGSVELLIQKEMVREGKSVPDTAAGLELRKEILELSERHREEMRALQEEIEGAAQDRDTTVLSELEREVQALRDQMTLLETEEQKLLSPAQPSPTPPPPEPHLIPAPRSVTSPLRTQPEGDRKPWHVKFRIVLLTFVCCCRVDDHL